MTMQRARRLASTAVVAALALGGLSACRAEPDVAAYIGSLGTITAAEVTQVFDQAENELTVSRDLVQQNQAGASAEPVPPVQVPFKQQDVLNSMLTVDILGQVAAAHNVKPAAEPTVDQVAKATSYSPTWEYTDLYTRAYQLRSALLPAVAPAELTDADLRVVYDRLSAAAPDQVTSFEQFKTELSEENKKALQQSLGLRDEVEKVVAAENVTTNPRYGPQELVLLSAQTGDAPLPLVSVSLGGTDASEAPFVAPAA
ncbi:hypothetical protein [Actinoplanes sp. NPDC049118]|uniref:hypothetical protein n=1 Tax=Actinoplanes sp. NPDC049118 TaxID=3155769 RepID=UPI0033C236C3